MCNNWSKITLSDAGSVLCATGEVYKTWFDQNQNAFFITFSNKDQALYLIMYGNQIEDLQNTCIMAKGEVAKLGNDPIMVVDPHQINKCDQGIPIHATLKPQPATSNNIITGENNAAPTQKDYPTNTPRPHAPTSEPQPATGGCSCASNSLNCDSFGGSWSAAQGCYEFCISQG